MYNIFISLAAFLVALGLLVTFHEFGHFWVAKKLNVKVLRFSIGFGKIIWSKHFKSGLEFCISAIPLGGYVKMLDEREGEVAEHERHLAFNRQSVYKRFAIVAAGPIFNFILAWVFFACMFMLGRQGIAPVVGEIIPESPASFVDVQVDDEIIRVSDMDTPTYKSLTRALVKELGEDRVDLTLSREGETHVVTLPMPNLKDGELTDLLEAMGIDIAVPALVGDIDPDTPAQRAGLQAGDRIKSVDGEPIKHWMEMVEYVSERPEQTIALGVQRNGTQFTVDIIPEEKVSGRGYLGVFLSDTLIRKEHFTFLQSLKLAVNQTIEYIALTFKMIYFLISGQASINHLSGPVSIAQIAGVTAQSGLSYFLDFLAVISVSLGVLNLLPIPMLDGGHLLYYLIEIVRGKPLSEASQMMGFRIGLIILVSLMAVAFYNDILRLV